MKLEDINFQPQWGRLYENPSDDLVWNLAKRGKVEIVLYKNEEKLVGYIKSKFRMIDLWRYEITILFDYDENPEMDDDFYDEGFIVYSSNEMKSIKGIGQEKAIDVDKERFSEIMERLKRYLRGEFRYEIVSEGNVLFLYSIWIENHMNAINILSEMIKGKDDLNSMVAMKIELFVLKGEDFFVKLTMSQISAMFDFR